MNSPSHTPVSGAGRCAAGSGRAGALRFVPLTVRSHFSFLDSTLSTTEITQLARQHGLPAVGLCDLGNLHGAAEFTAAARLAEVRPILGVEVRVKGRPLWLYVESSTGYARLCSWLATARGALDSPRLRPGPERTPEDEDPAGDHAGRATACRLPDFARFFHGAPDEVDTGGLVAVASDPNLAAYFPGRFYRALLTRGDLRRHREERSGSLPAVPVLPVHYALPEDRWRFEIAQSIRTLTLLRQEHPEKAGPGDRHFRRPAEVTRLFRGNEELLENTLEIADRCRFVIPFAKPQFPAFAPRDGSSAHDFLRSLVLAGAKRRYGAARFASVQGQIHEELGIIAKVGYEEYFLIVWDLLGDCRAQGIDWITRGSAADSLVCYCLGISNVCPIRFDLYFRRFLNEERMALNKLPDIDIDFPHDRKDDVVDLLFRKYGPRHCAVVGGFSTFRARSAFAEVAKVLGVAEREVRRFTEHFPWSFGGGWETQDAKAATRDPGDPSDRAQREGRLTALLRARIETRDLPLDEEPYRSGLAMAEFLEGVPRYAKMHPCGVVLSRQPMHELTPTFVSAKGWPTTDFDMDSVEAIGLVKMDILAQGGLAVMRDARAALAERGVVVDLDRCEQSSPPKRTSADGDREPEGPGPPSGQDSLEGAAARQQARPSTNGGSTETDPDGLSALLLVPDSTPRLAFDDAGIWDLISAGDARAVHHIESPAMTSLCRMCNVRDVDTLVAIVSVIRPGAANEDKKREFARRYQGLRPVAYAHPSLEPVLRTTFGLVVYEEHILQICDVFAGMPGGRADVLRRALVKEQWPVVAQIQQEFLACAARRGREPEDTQRVWELVAGFHGYAFCKAHSAAYGVEAYQAAWLKRNFPAEFMAAVLTNGKGFYRPLVYVLEAWRLGIAVVPPSVNEPGPAFDVVQRETAQPGPRGVRLGSQAIRAPLTRLASLTAKTKSRLLEERERARFASLSDFYLRVRPAAEEMELLSRAGAFDGFGGTRCEQFWEIQALRAQAGPAARADQEWLMAPGSDLVSRSDGRGASCGRLPGSLEEPTRLQRLTWETELYGFPVSGHPLELHPEIAWDTYCPVSRLGQYVGEDVTLCGLVIEDRVHHQVTGEPMKFLTLCDWTGMVETELFAQSYRSYGLATVRYPVLEVTGRVEPFENGRGCTLRVLRAGKPRTHGESPA